MKDFQKILSSFKIKDTLNPKIWTNPTNPKSAKLKPKIREILSDIAAEFAENLGEDVFIVDIHFMGSLAGFNWSEYSDFDLHLVIDFQDLGKNVELYKELFDLKKDAFNEKHDIKIYGYDIEVYAQDISEKKFSEGVYSIMNDEWISIPSKEGKNIDLELLKKKVEVWTDKINRALREASEGQNGEKLKTLKEKIKDFRKSGLEKGGEFSYENLIFKFLRRSGYIGKLFELKTKLKDKSLSIETKNEDF